MMHYALQVHNESVHIQTILASIMTNPVLSFHTWTSRDKWGVFHPLEYIHKKSINLLAQKKLNLFAKGIPKHLDTCSAETIPSPSISDKLPSRWTHTCTVPDLLLHETYNYFLSRIHLIFKKIGKHVLANSPIHFNSFFDVPFLLCNKWSTGPDAA